MNLKLIHDVLKKYPQIKSQPERELFLEDFLSSLATLSEEELLSLRQNILVISLERIAQANRLSKSFTSRKCNQDK